MTNKKEVQKKPVVGLTLVGMKSNIRIPVNTYVLIDGGQTRHVKWAVTVTRIGIKRHDEIMKLASKVVDTLEDGTKVFAMSDLDVAKELIEDWHLLKLDDGTKVPYNEGNLEAVYNIPEYKSSLVDSVYEGMSAGALGRAKKKLKR